MLLVSSREARLWIDMLEMCTETQGTICLNKMSFQTDKYFRKFSFAEVFHTDILTDICKLASGYVHCSKELCLVLDTYIFYFSAKKPLNPNNPFFRLVDLKAMGCCCKKLSYKPHCSHSNTLEDKANAVREKTLSMGLDAAKCCWVYPEGLSRPKIILSMS